MALNDVVYNKTVDVAQSMPVPVIFAKQNENGKRKVIVTLLKDGQPFVIGTGISGYIQGATAQNPVTKQPIRFKRALTSLDTTANTATFVIAESMTAEIGITQCEIALYDTTKPNEIVCTANINIEVQGTGMSLQDEMASDDYQAIVSIKTEVTAMRDEVRTKTNQAIAAQGAAETAAQNAYNSALGVQKIVAGNEAYTKQETDLKYSVAPRKVQTSTTGELKLTDADYGLSYLELQGNSEQYTATGTNLFDVKQLVKNMQTIAPSGITIGQDAHGKYIHILNNTFHNKRCLEFTNDITKTYKVGCKAKYSSGTGTGIVMSVMYKDGVGASTNVVLQQTEYTEMTMTIPAGREIDYFYFSYHTSGDYYDILLDSFYLYPVDAPSTEKPTGGYGTPTPEYPSEVKSVGDIPKDSDGVEIRNLFNNDAIFTDMTSFGYIELGDFEENIQYIIYKMPDNPMPGLYVRLSTDITKWAADPSDMQIIASSKYNATIGTQYSYKPSNGTKLYLKVTYTTNDEPLRMPTKEELKSLFGTIVFMLTKAATIDEYRPYIGENNGLVKIESSGINRAVVGDGPILTGNGDNIEVNTWTPGKIVLTQKNKSISWAYVELNLERGKTYTFYCKAKVEVIEGTQTDDATSVGFRQYPPGGITHGKKNLLQDGQYKDIYNTTGVIPDDATNMAFMLYLCASSASNGNVKMTVDDLMVVEGEKTLQEMKALKYQPYYNQITWIPLREPLQGLYDPKDAISKDGYVTQKYDSMEINLGICIGKSGWNENAFVMYIINESTKNFVNNGLAYSEVAYLSNMATAGKPLMVTTQGFNAKNGWYFAFYFLYGYLGLSKTSTDAENKQKILDTLGTDYKIKAWYQLKEPITYQIPVVYVETYDQETNVRCLNKVKPSSMGLDYKIAISSLIKRLEALESAAVNNGGK